MPKGGICVSRTHIVQKFLARRPAATADDMVTTGEGLYWKAVCVARWEGNNIKLVEGVYGLGPSRLQEELRTHILK